MKPSSLPRGTKISRFFTSRLGDWSLSMAMLLLACLLLSPFKAFIIAPHEGGQGRAVHVSDFIIFYSAARIANNGAPEKIYDIELQKKTQLELLQAPVDIRLPYLYPPQSMAVFAPPARLPIDDAFTLWLGVNLVLCLSMLLSMQYNLYLGQCNILMLAGLLAAVALLRRNYLTVASFILVFTAFKPPIMLLPILYLTIIYGWPLFFRLCAASVVIFILSIPFFGADIWLTYAKALISMPAHLGPDYGVDKMANIRALLFWLFSHENTALLNSLSAWLSAGSLIIVLWLGWRYRAASRTVQQLGLGLVVSLTCLFNPYLQFHSLILLFIPVVFLVAQGGIRAGSIVLAVMTLLNLASMELSLLPLVWTLAQIGLAIALIQYLRRAEVAA